jgi:hypothetical protein
LLAAAYDRPVSGHAAETVKRAGELWEAVDDPASQAVCAYSHDGQFKFGLRTFYERNPSLELPFGIATGYTHDDRLIFEGLVENFIRILNVERPQLDIVPIAFHLGGRSVLSGDGKEPTPSAIFAGRAMFIREIPSLN